MRNEERLGETKEEKCAQVVPCRSLTKRDILEKRQYPRIELGDMKGFRKWLFGVGGVWG